MRFLSGSPQDQPVASLGADQDIRALNAMVIIRLITIEQKVYRGGHGRLVSVPRSVHLRIALAGTVTGFYGPRCPFPSDTGRSRARQMDRAGATRGSARRRAGRRSRSLATAVHPR